MNRLRLFSCLCLLCAVAELAAQVLTGRVTDAANGEGIELATVCLVRNKQTIDYTLTDEKGYFTLERHDVKRTDALSVAYLGYASQQTSVNGQEKINFALKQEAVALKEVEIKGGRIFGRQDTTRYDISRFITGRDNTLKDALKKLPGVDVDGNGKISYNGKNISKFMVEGLDLTGGRYNLINDHLQAKDVANAEIINHYQPVKSLEQKVHTDDVAMNIKLKAEARDKWIYTLTLGTGVGSSPAILWTGGINALQIGQKSQSLYTYEADNTGRDLTQSNQQMTDASSGTLTKSVQTPQWFKMPTLQTPIEASRLRMNRSHALNINRVSRPSDDKRVRLSLGYLHDEFQQTTHNQSTYYQPNQAIVSTDESNHSTRKDDRFTAEMEIENNTAKSYSKELLHAQGGWREGTSTLSATGTSHLQQIKMPDMALQNQYRHTLNGASATWDLSSVAQATYQPASLRIDGVRQDLNAGHLYTDNALSWVRKFGFLSQQYTGGIEAEALLMHTNQSACSAYLRPKWEYVRGNLTLSFSSRLQWKRFNKQQTSFLWLSPWLYARLRTGFHHEWSGNAGINQSCSEWGAFTPDSYQQDYRTMVFNSNQVPVNKTYSVQLEHEYKHALHELFWTWKIAYLFNRSSHITNLSITDGQYTYTRLDCPTLFRQVGSEANMSKGIYAWHTKLKLQLAYNYGRGESMFNEQVTPYRHHQAVVGPEIIFSPQWGELHYTGNFCYEKQQNGTKADRQSLLNWQQALQWTQSFGKLDLTAGAVHFRNELSNGQKVCTLLADASAVWRGKKLRLTLQLRNLFNKQAYEYTLFNGNLTTTNRYELRGRECYIKAQWNL